MQAHQTVRVPEHVLVRTVDRELVLLNLDNEEYYGLDETGAAVWAALDSAPTIGAAVDQLLEQFDVEREVLAGDVERLLAELDARGLVEIAAP
jgi:hypothetical protein